MPRAAIQALFKERDTRRQFRDDMGVDVLFVSIGHISSETPEVDEQRIATWRAKWKKLNYVTLAQAEGLEIYYKLKARAEAQADIIEAFTEVMQDVSLKIAPGADIDLDEIILLYAAQILDAIAEQPSGLFSHLRLKAPDSNVSAEPNG